MDTSKRTDQPQRGVESVKSVLSRSVDFEFDELTPEQRITFRRELDTIAAREAIDRDVADIQRRVAYFEHRVPVKYRTAALATFELDADDAPHRRKQERVVRASESIVERYPGRIDDPHYPYLLGWRGKYGTGKTRMLWSIARELYVEHGVPFAIVTAEDMIADIRAGWHDAADETAHRRVAHYRAPFFLGVDEFTAEHMTGNPTKHAHNVASWREERGKLTVFVSNDDDATFMKLLGGSLADRMRGSSDVWDFGAKSYRPKQRRQ